MWVAIPICAILLLFAVDLSSAAPSYTPPIICESGDASPCNYVQTLTAVEGYDCRFTDTSTSGKTSGDAGCLSLEFTGDTFAKCPTGACEDVTFSGSATAKCIELTSCYNFPFFERSTAECTGEQSCKIARVSGMASADCTGAQSCSGATFLQTSSVSCGARDDKSESSCSDATFLGSSSAVCEKNGCLRSVFSDSAEATCNSKDSCAKTLFTGSSSARCTANSACDTATFMGSSTAYCDTEFACTHDMFDLDGVADMNIAKFFDKACCIGDFCPLYKPLCVGCIDSECADYRVRGVDGKIPDNFIGSDQRDKVIRMTIDYVTELPSSGFLEGFINLERLDLSSETNDLSELPFDLLDLAPSLTYLDLGANVNLREIPIDFTKHNNSAKFTLTYNKQVLGCYDGKVTGPGVGCYPALGYTTDDVLASSENHWVSYSGLAPSVKSAEGCPAQGCPTTGGIMLTITGSQFGGPLDNNNTQRVLVNGVNCPIKSRAETLIKCALPQGAGLNRLVEVWAFNVPSTERILVNYARPNVTSLTSENCTSDTSTSSELVGCSRTGGTFTINGQNFGKGGAKVLIGSTLYQGTTVTHSGSKHTQLVVQFQEGYQETLTVIVLANDGESSTQQALLSYYQCQPGSFQNVDAIECEPCQPGKYADMPSSKECKLCDPDSYPVNGIQCVDCPSESVRRQDLKNTNTTNTNMCECIRGFVALDKIAFQEIEGVLKDGLPENRVNGNRVLSSVKNILDQHEQGPSQTYTDLISDKLEFYCTPCPKGSDCSLPGQSIHTLKAQSGYSAPAKLEGALQLSFYECDPVGACTGATTCLQGFTGVKCAECATNYFRSDNNCLRCPEDAGTNIFLMVFGYLGYSMYLALMAMITMAGALKDIDFFAISLKIFISGMQLNSLAQILPFEWISPITETLAVQQTVSNAGPAALSMDCAVGDMTGYTARPFYFKCVNNLLFPVFLALVALPFSCLVGRLNKKTIKQFQKLVDDGNLETAEIGPLESQEKQGSEKKENYNDNNNKKNQNLDKETIIRMATRCKSTSANEKERKKHMALAKKAKTASAIEFMDALVGFLVIMIFMIHPSTTTMTFKLLACENTGTVLNPASHLTADMSIQCWTGNHPLWVLAIGLPTLVLLVIGIPCMGFVIMYKNRDVIKQLINDPKGTTGIKRKDIAIKVKYGFLFKGYDAELYYWEVFVIVRKVALVVVLVSLYTVPQVQIWASVLVIFVAWSGQLICNPMVDTKQLKCVESDEGEKEWIPVITKTLDAQEKFSLLVSAVIFGFGQLLFFEEVPRALKICVTVTVFIFLLCWFLDFAMMSVYTKANLTQKILTKCCRKCKGKQLARSIQRKKFYAEQTSDEEVMADQSKFVQGGSTAVVPVEAKSETGTAEEISGTAKSEIERSGTAKPEGEGDVAVSPQTEPGSLKIEIKQQPQQQLPAVISE